MLKNYLKVAYRNFLKQKSYTIINVLGLAFAIASALLIFLYINNELEYDSMHKDPDNTYGLGVSITDKEGNVQHYPVAPGGWSNRIQQNVPEVVEVTKLDFFGYPATLHNKSTDRIILTEEIRWVLPNMPAIFQLEMVKGNPERALDNPNALLLSESSAQKLFGSTDPINQLITFKHPFVGDGTPIELMVTGIYKDFPANSHIKPSQIVNIFSVKPIFDQNPEGSFDQYWNSVNFNGGFFNTYVKLRPDANTDNLKRELERLSIETVKSDSAFQAQGNKMMFTLQPLRDLHFDTTTDWEFDNKGSKSNLYIFLTVAILILVIACINYTNLATARSAKRAKEVGMRKSLGGLRSELAYQFLQESAFIAVLALIVGVLIALLILPGFNTLANKDFSYLDFLQVKTLLLVIAVMLFITIAGGAYPAFVLSSFNPVKVLKGAITKGKGAEFFRKTLVAVQFIVAMMMVLAAVIMTRQMDLIQQSKLSEKGNQILSIRFGGTAPNEKYEPLKQAILQDKDIEFVTIGNHLPRQEFFGFIGVQYRFAEVGDQEYQWSQLSVDYNFPKTFGLEFISGRDFDPQNTADSSAIILNETAVAILNKSANEAVGLGGENIRTKRIGNVIGVVKDFPYRSMHQKIEPLVISPRLHNIDRIVYVQLPKGKFAEKIAFIEDTWRRVIPDVGFDYWFLSEEFNKMYKTERTVSSLVKSFTVLALIITVLGLYGLASYTAEQRTKEVGIRKVLGATSTQVVLMIGYSFLKIFFIATLIAVPLAWYFADKWLSSFVYRTSMDVTLFVSTIASLMVLTFVTVSYEVWRAAVANPVNAIRHE